MAALREYLRDRELPARLGDDVLALPTDEALIERLVRGHGASHDAVRGLELLHARWKPGVACVGLWRVRLEGDGPVERFVTWKRYMAGKAERVLRDARDDERAAAAAQPLEPWAPLPSGDGFIAVFPADRVLVGAARVLDERRRARRLDAAGLWPGAVLRRRASHFELLRYKPERRAVARLDAKLRDAPPERARRRLALRILEPGEASIVAAQRRALEEAHASAGGATLLLPRLLLHDERDGLLVEEWLEGRAFAPNSFEHARPAGRAVAALHALPLEGDGRRPRPSGALADELLARASETRARAAELDAVLERRASRPAARTWTHGDLHPDQLFETADGWALLDLDTVREGAPMSDLASWIADRLSEDPELGLDEAGGELLEGYREAGGSADGIELGSLVVRALAKRASAALRRLESGALERAARLLDCAARAGGAA